MVGPLSEDELAAFKRDGYHAACEPYACTAQHTVTSKVLIAVRVRLGVCAAEVCCLRSAAAQFAINSGRARTAP